MRSLVLGILLVSAVQVVTVGAQSQPAAEPARCGAERPSPSPAACKPTLQRPAVRHRAAPPRAGMRRRARHRTCSRMRARTWHVRKPRAPRQRARLAPHPEIRPAPSAPAARSKSPVSFCTDGRTSSASTSDTGSRSPERQARRRRRATPSGLPRRHRRPSRSSKSFRTSRIGVRSRPSPRRRRRQAPHTPLCSTFRCSRCACSPRRASSFARSVAVAGSREARRLAALVATRLLRSASRRTLRQP